MPIDRDRRSTRAETVSQLRKQLADAEAEAQALRQLLARIQGDLVDVFVGAGPHWRMALSILEKHWPKKWGER